MEEGTRVGEWVPLLYEGPEVTVESHVTGDPVQVDKGEEDTLTVSV